MRIKCSVIIDNPEYREYFLKKVTCLGVKVEVTGNIIKAEYVGYNQGLSEVLINTFETEPRSTIRVSTH